MVLTDPQDNSFEFTDAEIDRVKEVAKETAVEYVNEYGGPFETPSDWDATAWFGFDDQKAGIDSERSRAAFQVYSETFSAETGRLCQ